MKEILSLEQELRAARAGKGRKKAVPAHPLPDAKQSERPWQPDIDQVQQTMREVLQAMASFSGVEIPGLPADVEDNGTRLPGLDIQTLKDRFRIDLEGFSIKTAEELSKRAREQALAAVDAIRNEVEGRIDEVAAELRAQVQLPGQVREEMEPMVEKAASGLEASLSQKIERMFAEREELFQRKLQETGGSVQGPSNAVEEAAARLEASLSQKIEQMFAEREELFQRKLQEALCSAEGLRVPEEEAIPSVEASLTQKLEHLFTEREQSLQARFLEALSPIQTRMDTVEEGGAKLEKSVSQQVEMMFFEREQLVQERLQGEQRSVQAQASMIEEAKAGLEGSLSQKVEHLFAERERFAQERLQEALGPVQSQIRALEQIVQQIRGLKPDSVLQLRVERPDAAETTAEKDESNSGNGINEFLDRALARLGSSVSGVTGTSHGESAQGAARGAGDQGNSIFFNEIEEKERRVQQALDELDRLGSNDPHPMAK